MPDRMRRVNESVREVLSEALPELKDPRIGFVTHETRDGDALGSIRGMKLALDSLGKNVQMHLAGELDLPLEYTFMELGDLRRTLPDDAAERILLALDCANASRTGLEAELIARVPLSLDVDHHHDNSRFARINLIVPDASSTGEIVRDILRELALGLTPEIAEALYVALVTDTGRFGYTNTTPKAHRLAAELLEAGADFHNVFHQVYENVAFKKLKLKAPAFERAQVYEGGRLVGSYLLRSDFNELDVGEEYAEGIIDDLRAVAGAELAFMIREPPEPPDAPRRISMRS